jgi:hypothetical protein
VGKLRVHRDLVATRNQILDAIEDDGDYLLIQEKIFEGMDLDQIYKKAKEHHESRKV